MAGSAAGAGWSSQSSPVSGSLQRVTCPSTSVCFAVGGSNKVIKYSTGAWSDVHGTINSGALYGISCWDSSNCLAVGGSGAIWYTSNAGTSWTQEPQPTGWSSPILAGVACPSSSPGTCFIGSADGTSNKGAIAESTNVTSGASATWTAQTSPTTQKIYMMRCSSTTFCFAAGASGLIMSNRSGSWATDTLPAGTTGESFRGLACPDTTVCYASGDNGDVIKFNGTSWSSDGTPTTSALKSISCPDETHCVAVGASGTAVATLDGTNWVTETSGTSNELDGSSCPSVSTCWAVGDQTGTTEVIRATTTGGGPGWIKESSGTSSNLEGVSCPTALMCVAVGASGAVERTDDGGMTWISSTISGSPSLYSISCASTTMCVAGSTSGNVYVYDGTSWTSKSTGSGSNVNAVSCPTTSVCYMASNNYIEESTNGGSSWGASLYTTLYPPYTSISCPSTTTCTAWDSGANNFTAEYDIYSQGFGWYNNYAGVFSVLNDDSCPTTSFCAAVGNSGTIITGNGQTSWTSRTSGVSAALNGVDCYDASNCLAVGASGTLDVTSNGGANWASETSPSGLGSTALNSVAYQGASAAVAVGDGGTIISLYTMGSTSCNAGSLALSTPSAVSFPGVTLNGTADKTVTTTVGLLPDDESSAHSGWSVSATSTTFKDSGGDTLPTTATTVTGATLAGASGECVIASNSIGYNVTLPAGTSAPTAAKIVNAASGTGEGPVDAAIALSLAVPANTRIGSYTSTWTLTIANSP